MTDGNPKFKADERCNNYFARLETWTREEAAALLLKLDPRVVLRRDSISGLRPVDDWQPYHDLLEMIKRARTAFPHRSPLKPGLVMDWAGQNGLHPPEGLMDAIINAGQISRFYMTIFPEDDGGPSINSPSSNQAKASLHHKTKASLLKLIAGMAIRGYRYDPFSKQNIAISEIETDLRLLNIPMSDDTIRRWVREACELIDWETVDEDVKPSKS